MAELRAIVGSLRSSSIYKSSPRYVVDQPDFYNIVVTGETALSPEALLAKTQAIEASFGRDRSAERVKGPRTLDIDILIYGGERIATPYLLVPHPGITERAFVLVPLLELDPDFRHPETGLPLSSYLGSVSGQGIYLCADCPL